MTASSGPDESNREPTPEERGLLTEMISGYQRSQMVLVASQLGLADLIAAGPKTLTELAEATQSNPDSLRRFLRTLIGYGLFRQEEDGRYRMTPLAEPLREDAPGSLRPMAMVAAIDTYRSWGELLHCVQTGQDGFAKAYGMPAADYRTQHPESNRYFNAWMSVGARRRIESFLDAYDFGDTGLVVDVGGGDGTLLLGILGRHPGLRGVLFDLPRAVGDFEQGSADASAVSRLRIEAGSFFDGLPGSGDYYILSLILHNWPDEDARRILERCRVAIKPDGRLLVLDQVVRDGAPPRSMSDLNMLVNCGALERTESEWRRLLASGGFEIASIGKAPDYIEAVPV